MRQAITVGIVSSIVATMLYLYLLDPIIRAFGGVVIAASTYLATGVLDSLYMKAAIGIPPDSAFPIYGMLSGIFAGMSIGVIASAIRSFLPSTAPQPVEKRRKRLFGIAIPLILFLGIAITYRYWTHFFQLEVVTSFHHHMAIVSPYLDDQEEEEIRSNWALMESEADYRRIMERLSAVARAQGINLPENPVYKLVTF